MSSAARTQWTALPKGIRKSNEAVAETIENNVRKLIINESPVDPAYYKKMSKLLDALIEQRRKGAIEYKQYLARITALTKEAATPGGSSGGYPISMDTAAKRALYNNLSKDEALALKMDRAVQNSHMDGWRGNAMKTKRVKLAIRTVLDEASRAQQPSSTTNIHQKIATGDYPLEILTEQILELVKHQHEY